jgi:elongation factor Ts
VKIPEKTVKDVLTEAIAKTGENIQIRRFVRFQLGS